MGATDHDWRALEYVRTKGSALYLATPSDPSNNTERPLIPRVSAQSTTQGDDVYVYMVIHVARVRINRVRLPVLLVVS